MCLNVFNKIGYIFCSYMSYGYIHYYLFTPLKGFRLVKSFIFEKGDPATPPREGDVWQCPSDPQLLFFSSWPLAVLNLKLIYEWPILSEFLILATVLIIMFLPLKIFLPRFKFFYCCILKSLYQRILKIIVPILSVSYSVQHSGNWAASLIKITCNDCLWDDDKIQYIFCY